MRAKNIKMGERYEIKNRPGYDFVIPIRIVLKNTYSSDAPKFSFITVMCLYYARASKQVIQAYFKPSVMVKTKKINKEAKT